MSFPAAVILPYFCKPLQVVDLQVLTKHLWLVLSTLHVHIFHVAGTFTFCIYSTCIFYLLVCLSSLLVCLHYHLHEAVVAKLHVQQVDMYKGIVK